MSFCVANKSNLRHIHPGLPELAESDKRSVITKFRCTQEEREFFKKLADISGKYNSDWLTDQVVGSANKAH